MQPWRPVPLLKTDSDTVTFQRILQKFLRTAFFIEHLWWKKPKCGYDLVVVNKERYGRPDLSESRKQLSSIITNQLGRKFYCAKKECLLKQHQHFRKGMLFMKKGVRVKTCERIASWHHCPFLINKWNKKIHILIRIWK